MTHSHIAYSKRYFIARNLAKDGLDKHSFTKRKSLSLRLLRPSRAQRWAAASPWEVAVSTVLQSSARFFHQDFTRSLPHQSLANHNPPSQPKASLIQPLARDFTTWTISSSCVELRAKTFSRPEMTMILVDRKVMKPQCRKWWVTFLSLF